MRIAAVIPASPTRLWTGQLDRLCGSLTVHYRISQAAINRPRPMIFLVTIPVMLRVCMWASKVPGGQGFTVARLAFIWSTVLTLACRLARLMARVFTPRSARVSRVTGLTMFGVDLRMGCIVLRSPPIHRRSAGTCLYLRCNGHVLTGHLTPPLRDSPTHRRCYLRARLVL